MINLLSPGRKAELRAARRNIVLRKYVYTLLFLSFVVAGSYAVGYGLLVSQEETYKKQIAQYEPQKSQYSETIAKANEYNKNLAIAKTILDNELSYSTFTTMIAQTIPRSVVLSSLNVTSKDIGKPLELTFDAKSYQDSLTTKDAFEKSPYFKSVALKSTDKINTGVYPYKFILIMTFEKEVFTSAVKAGTL